MIVRSSEPISTKESDPLQLAQDFIEYSQLEQARVVLEKAVKANSNSKEIHEELLSLYQSTEDFANFQKISARRGIYIILTILGNRARAVKGLLFESKNFGYVLISCLE